MTAFVDTNILIRHLTGQPPEMAAAATALLSSGEQLLLADLIVAEIVYVLESFYKTSRTQTAEALRSIIGFHSISCVDSDLLFRAIEVYENHRIDFAEAYLVACAETTRVSKIASFDASIDRVTSVKRLEPS